MGSTPPLLLKMSKRKPKKNYLKTFGFGLDPPPHPFWTMSKRKQLFSQDYFPQSSKYLCFLTFLLVILLPVGLPFLVFRFTEEKCRLGKLTFYAAQVLFLCDNGLGIEPHIDRIFNKIIILSCLFTNLQREAIVLRNFYQIEIRFRLIILTAILGN